MATFSLYLLVTESTPPLVRSMLPSLDSTSPLVILREQEILIIQNWEYRILCCPPFGHCPISFNFLHTCIVHLEAQSNMLMFVLKGGFLVNSSVNLIIFWYTLTTLSMVHLNHTSGTPHLKRWVIIDIHWPHQTLCIWTNISSSTHLNR